MNGISTITANAHLLLGSIRKARTLYGPVSMKLAQLEGQLRSMTVSKITDLTGKGLMVDTYV